MIKYTIFAFLSIVLISQAQQVCKSKKTKIPSYIKPIASKTFEGNLNSQIIFLADQLERNVEQKYKNFPIAIIPFKNLSDINHSGDFGRLLSENLQHELQIRNWPVIDTTILRKINLKNLNKNNISIAVIGTFTILGRSLLINAKIVRVIDGMILSTGQAIVPIPENISLYDTKEEITTLNVVGE